LRDRFEVLLYAPLPALVGRLSALAARLQRGRLAVYLAITFVTLALILIGLRWT
jgi:hypothetical protein